MGNVGVLEFAGRNDTPSEVERNGGRRVFWEWSGHEMFEAMEVMGSHQYNIDGKVGASAGRFRVKRNSTLWGVRK